MTYKHFRKIQLYILISLICFIFTNNFQIILKTRNITETDQKFYFFYIFLTKTDKTEVNPKNDQFFNYFLSSNGVNPSILDNYIRDKQTKSLSSQPSLIDETILNLKILVNESISLFKKIVASVKYRSLLGQKWLNSKRQFFLKRLERVVGPRGRPLVEGMLFGDLSGINQETYHSFKVIGILHILSASSANFTIFLHFLLFFLKPLSTYLSKKALFCLNFSIILLYFSLVGSSASTLRAFLTLTLAFYAVFILKRAHLSIFNLYLVAIYMLTINPFYLDSLSFQFSFLASFGIIFLYNYLIKEPFINKNLLLKNLLLTSCAQFFLLPIMISRFNELNYLAIPANFIVLPLVELLTVLFLASFICLFVSNLFSIVFFERFLSFMINKAIDILFYLIDLLEKSPWKSFVFKTNKDLYVGIFFVLNLLVIVGIFVLKNQKYSKNQYRIFK